MSARMAWSLGLIGSGLLAVLGGLSACSSTGGSGGALSSGGNGRETGMWVPSSEPTFTSIGRDARYSIVYSQSRDTYVFEQEYGSARRPTERMTWLITVPAYPPIGRALDLETDIADGWVMEEISGASTHVAPLNGRITIHAKTGDMISATLNVWAAGETPKAGMVDQPKVTLARRVDLERRTPYTPQYLEMETEGGVVTMTEDE